MRCTPLISILVTLVGSTAPLAAMAAGGAGGGAGMSAGQGGGSLGGYGANGNGNGAYIPPPNSPASVDGDKFSIVISTSGSSKKTLSSLMFRTKDLTCDYFTPWGITSMPYTEQAKDRTTDEFRGEVKDDSGNYVKISGTALSTGAVKGTIVVHQAHGNKTTTYDFHGGTPGSPEAQQAKDEANDHSAGADANEH